jgi:uncharacterized protein (TIGR02453 family)
MTAKPIFTMDTFRFFRELARNNHKPWMDANRERYKSCVVVPFRALLDRLAPAARKLNPRFETSGRVGMNFSRINRDIRFARDKSPYRSQMYLFFREADAEGAQVYVSLSAEAVTAGFRIYGSGKESPLALLARPRAQENAKWLARQQRRLGKKYDSYWYSAVKGEWTKHDGWPVKPEDWKRLQGWIVRKKLAPASATRSSFNRDIAQIHRDVYPLYRFTASPDWKP